MRVSFSFVQLRLPFPCTCYMFLCRLACSRMFWQKLCECTDSALNRINVCSLLSVAHQSKYIPQEKAQRVIGSGDFIVDFIFNFLSISLSYIPHSSMIENKYISQCVSVSMLFTIRQFVLHPHGKTTHRISVKMR